MRIAQPPISLLVVDPDDAGAHVAEGFSNKIGTVETAIAASEGEAWRELTTRTYSFIVMEWKLGERNGARLVNRIRSHPQYALTPLLVTNALDSELQADFRLLDDFPCTRLTAKPLSLARFSRDVEELLEENRWYHANRTRISALFSDPARSAEAAERLVSELLAKAPAALPFLLCVGESLLEANRLKASETVFRRALAVDGRSLRALTGLGRCLFLDGRGNEAAGYLRIARRECPANVHRLCMLGELELAQLRPEEARRRFDEALAVDEAEPRAESGLVLCRNVEDHVRKHSGAGLPRDFARLCNAVGVALVRDGEIERGIEQYQAALQLLRDDVMMARVMFNVGLGFVKWKRPMDARSWLEEADRLGSGRFTRARAMLQRLDLESYPHTAAAMQRAVSGDDPIDDVIDMTIFEEEKL